MAANRAWTMRGGAVAAALALVLAPATAAQLHKKHLPRPHQPATLMSSSIGSFTPAAADARFGSSFGRIGLDSSGFRFTPSSTPGDSNRRVTVAVRARAVTPAQAERNALASSNGLGETPYAYNLGVAVGWKRFAISSDYNKVNLGPVSGGREGADLALSYGGHRWSTRLAVAADRSTSDVPRVIDMVNGMSVDLGGSYALSNRFDVTGGVRYRTEHDRLLTIADDRRDSQAVYVGTAFRF